MEALTETLVSSALYVVATPIGNLADISLRALHILAGVDQIAAEDTRHSSRLLNHYGIQSSLISLHEHNEQARTEELINCLAQGQNVALISDAGTPLISDPGYGLVQRVAAAGYPVIPIPGACAVVTALSAAGLPTDAFTFVGFSPSKAGARKRFFESHAGRQETWVFYESPRRLVASLENLLDAVGTDRQVTIARELTKMHETLLRGELGELVDNLRADPGQCRGEIVVLVNGLPAMQVAALDDDADRLLKLLLAELPVTRAAQIVAHYRDLPRRQVYQRALTLQD